jgi:hypothetical protein
MLPAIAAGAPNLPGATLISDRAELLRDLARIGPRLTTTVVVNGRPVLLHAAIQLVSQLPTSTVVGLRYRYLSIRPNPFAAQAPVSRREDWSDVPTPKEVVLGVLQCQHERDRSLRQRANLALGALLAMGPVISAALLILTRG